MTPTASALPDDVDTRKAMLVVAAGEKAGLQVEAAALKVEIARLVIINERAETRIAGLHGIIKQLERARFGRSSEKLDPAKRHVPAGLCLRRGSDRTGRHRGRA